MQMQSYDNHSFKPLQANSKHGFPALLSFFPPVMGQIIKGHIIKGLSIFISGVILFTLSFMGFTAGNGVTVKNHDRESLIAVSVIELLLFIILFFWNVYDAYNSNKRS